MAFGQSSSESCIFIAQSCLPLLGTPPSMFPPEPSGSGFLLARCRVHAELGVPDLWPFGFSQHLQD